MPVSEGCLSPLSVSLFISFFFFFSFVYSLPFLLFVLYFLLHGPSPVPVLRCLISLSLNSADLPFYLTRPSSLAIYDCFVSTFFPRLFPFSSEYHVMYVMMLDDAAARITVQIDANATLPRINSTDNPPFSPLRLHELPIICIRDQRAASKPPHQVFLYQGWILLPDCATV